MCKSHFKSNYYHIQELCAHELCVKAAEILSFFEYYSVTVLYTVVNFDQKKLFKDKS